MESYNSADGGCPQSAAYVTSRSHDIESAQVILWRPLPVCLLKTPEYSRLHLLVEEFHKTTPSLSTCLLFAPTTQVAAQNPPWLANHSLANSARQQVTQILLTSASPVLCSRTFYCLHHQKPLHSMTGSTNIIIRFGTFAGESVARFWR